MKSIYIHIPYCKQKCLYCDFNSYSNKEDTINKYFDALIEEIKSYNIKELNTIYFDTKNKYDILYKEMNIETSAKNNVAITIILIITLIINAINIIFLAR